MVRTVSAITFLVFTLWSHAALSAVTAGKFKLVKGEVTILRESTSIQANVGDEVFSSDKIMTGPNSSTGIVMQDGALLSFGPKTVMVLNDFHYEPVHRDGNMLISLLKGTMRFVTGSLGKFRHDAVLIRTQTATIGIRGTDFVVSAEDEE